VGRGSDPLLRCCAGRLPFRDDDAPRLYASIRGDDPPRPRSLVPDLPEALEAIVLRALAKIPADRPGTARELDEALVSGTPRGRVDLEKKRAGVSTGPFHERPELS
jgi:serine/threonine protein kinase